MTRFFYHWKNRHAGEFRTGISLHGHTSQSKEGLGFFPSAINNMLLVPSVIHWAEQRHKRKWKEEFNYHNGYWTSPVSPEAAYDLEAEQIEQLGLKAFVSLTDHDEIAACESLRTDHRAGPDIPVSLEWTVPYKTAVFHVGMHNLPPREAQACLKSFCEYTKHPTPNILNEILKKIADMPDSLIVLNHPLSDQGQIGHEIHASMVEDFLAHHHQVIHALEINALQPWEMNGRVSKIAKEIGLPMVAGGDRHGFEPNGAINLTNAASFKEFAYEIREHKNNSILFMPQSREPLAIRYAENVQTIMDYYPELGDRASWHDRVFYRCPDGITRSLTQMVGKRFYALDITDATLGVFGFTLDEIIKPIVPLLARSDKKIT